MATFGANDPRRYQNIYGRIDISGQAAVQIGDNILQEDPNKAKYQRFLDSLYFPELYAREDSISEAHHGTFNWVFPTKSNLQPYHQSSSTKRAHHLVAASSPPLASFGAPRPLARFPEVAVRHILTRWLMDPDDGRMLWLKGKAGSGKSTLMSYLADNAVAGRLPCSPDAAQRQVIVLTHFLWELGSSMQRSALGMLRSLLWKFFSRYSDLGLPMFLRSQLSSKPAWTRNDLHAALGAVLSSPNLEFRIFIDGLDECISIEERDSVLSLLRMLEHRRNVKLCVSSRPERKYELELQGSPFLRLDDATGSDMEKYATDALQAAMLQLQTNAHTGRLWIAKLVPRLLDKAHGVFVWLRVAVQSLIRGLQNMDTWEALLARLEEMPEDIERLYMHMLNRGRDAFKHYASSSPLMFQLLLSNEGSMSLAQFAWARDDHLRMQFLQSGLSVHDIDGFLHQLDLETLIIWITSHCANFVEVWDPKASDKHYAPKVSWADLLKRQVDQDDALMRAYTRSQGMIQVRFIHKTVGHFLTESMEGQKIMLDCPKTVDNIRQAIAEGDLVLLLCSVAIRGSLSSARLAVHLRAAWNLERWYDHTATVLSCLERIEFGPEDHNWHHDYLWGHRDLVTVPKCPYALLFWCVRNGRFDFVSKYVTANAEHIPTKIIGHLLSTFIRSQMLIADKDIMKDESTLTSGLQLLLKAGANPNSSTLFSPLSTYARWDTEVSIMCYCMYVLNFPHWITTKAFHTIMQTLVILLQAGAEAHSLWPKPLFDMFKSNTITDLGKHGAISEVELWIKVIDHSYECERSDCASLQIRDLIGTERIQRPQILAFKGPGGWYAVRTPGISDMIWEILSPRDVKHAHYCGGNSTGLGASHNLGALSYDANWPQEWPCEVLEGSRKMSGFRSVLEHVGWTEDEIRATFEDSILSTIHGLSLKQIESLQFTSAYGKSTQDLDDSYSEKADVEWYKEPI